MKVLGKTITTIIDETACEYKNDVFEIESLFLQSAMEADNINSNVDATKNLDDSTFSQRLLQKAREIIKTIEGLLARIAEKIHNVFLRFLQSDAGFQDDCRKAMVRNKPLEGIKLITYQYNDARLDGIMNNLFTATQKLLSSMTTDYQDMKDSSNVGTGDSPVIQTLLRNASVPDEYSNDINQFFLYMRDSFRVQKKETLFIAANAREYYKIADSAKGIESYANKRRSQLQQLSNSLKRKLETIIKSTAKQEIKRNSIKQLHHVSHIFSFYSRALEIYVQLKIEKSLTYRTVLKKLYHFS